MAEVIQEDILKQISKVGIKPTYNHTSGLIRATIEDYTRDSLQFAVKNISLIHFF